MKKITYYILIVLTAILVLGCTPQGPTCSHEWTDWEVKLEATCSEDGYKTRNCILCGQESKETISKTGQHHFINGVCACGEREGMFSVKHQHSFTDSVCVCGYIEDNCLHELETKQMPANRYNGHFVVLNYEECNKCNKKYIDLGQLRIIMTGIIDSEEDLEIVETDEYVRQTMYIDTDNDRISCVLTMIMFGNSENDNVVYLEIKENDEVIFDGEVNIAMPQHEHKYTNNICECGKVEKYCTHTSSEKVEVSLNEFNTCINSFEYHICSKCKEKYIESELFDELYELHEEIWNYDYKSYNDCDIQKAEFRSSSCPLAIETVFVEEEPVYCKFISLIEELDGLDGIFYINTVSEPPVHVHEFVNGMCICGAREEENIPLYSEEELKNLDTTVYFWHAYGQSIQAILDNIIKEFNKIYPNIKIEHASQGGYTDLRDKIAKSIRIGAAPTLAVAYPDDVLLYLQGHAVSDLDKFVNHPVYGLTDQQLNDFIENYLDEGKIYDSEGTLYSLPFNKSAEVVYFNASWFERHGLLEKYNLGQIKNGVFVRNKNAHLTWEDIEEIGKYYVSTSEYQQNYNYLLSYESEANLFVNLTKQWQGEYVEITGLNQGSYVFNNKQSKDAIKWFRDGYNQGYFVTPYGLGSQFASDAFLQEQVKMIICSSAAYAYNNPQDNFVLGVLPYPQKEAAYGKGEDEYVLQDGINISLFNCRDKDEQLAGWLFMKFLTTWHPELTYEEQPTVIWCENTWYLPNIKTLANHEKYKSFLFDNDNNNTKKILSQVVEIYNEQVSKNYIIPPFNGSSFGREEVEYLVLSVLYAEFSIDSAYESAISKLQ